MKVKTPYNRIACSLNNSAAIDKNGEVYVWGLSKTGILGDNKHSNGVKRFFFFSLIFF